MVSAICPTKTAHRNSLLRSAVVALSALSLFGVSGCAGSEDDAAPEAPTQAVTSENQLAVQADAFRLIASNDVLRALQIYGTANANLRLEELGKEFVSDENWQGNFQLFLSTAVTAIVKNGNEAGTVGFYNPWCDVAMLVDWKKADRSEGFKIADIDILPGAYIRGKPDQMAAFPEWMEQDVYAPQAVAEVTARTIIALRNTYEGNGEGPLKLLDPEMRELMPLAASTPFDVFKTTLAPVYAEEPSTRKLVREWLLIQGDALDGKSDRDGRIGAGIELLAKLPIPVRNSFTPVAFVEADAGQVLILVSKADPGILATLQASGIGDQGNLERFDVVALKPVIAAFEEGADE